MPDWTITVDDDLERDVDALVKTLRPKTSRSALVRMWMQDGIRAAKRDGLAGTARVDDTGTRRRS